MNHEFLSFPRFFLFLILLFPTVSSAQILTNGDFESGGSGIGFLVHDYTLINPPNGTSNPGFYTRTTDPTLFNSTYISAGDHTTGSGNMMVFDGSLLSNRFFWTTGNTGGAIGGFTAGTTYTFSFWIKSVSDEVVDDATRASIGIFFVNANSINPANQNFLAPLPAEGWVNIQYSFVATADNVMVRLKTNNPGPVGHDFAIDDFSIVEGGLTFAASYAFVSPTCPNGSDGAITVNVTGGTLPYSAFVLTGSASQTNNNGVFTGLGEGTYQVSVSDAVGNSFTQSDIVLVAPNDLVVNEPATICAGETTQLSASGGTGNYVWTAIPADASLTESTSATPNVTPSVTTTYTVTSGTLASDVNLIENGDFTQGNTLFVTGYTQVEDPNPFGVQSACDIVTNPADWFTPFSACGDHTSGTGNMMVFDGAVIPNNDTVVWSNLNSLTVLPNTNYTFSYFVASVSPESPALLEVMINGVSQGSAVSAPGATCLWNEVSYDWNSGSATSVTIAIYDRNYSSGGNDFALDDITFREAETCVYQKSVTITVNPANLVPEFLQVAPVCRNDFISALPTTSQNGITGSWSPAIDNAATTTYTFTPDVGQCALSATMTITVNEKPEFTISGGCDGVRFTLTSQLGDAEGAAYAWSDPNGMPIGSESAVVVTTSGIYELTVTQNGCSSTQPFHVLSAQCQIQKGISANNDGLNDSFDLAGFNVSRLQIFNRYGRAVYSKTDYADEWIGQSDSGEDLPDATYYYVIDFADERPQSGWIYLNRAQ